MTSRYHRGRGYGRLIKGIYVFFIGVVLFAIAAKVYRASNYEQGSFLIWIGILLLLLFVLLISLFLSEQWRKHVLLLGASVALAIYIVEATLVWWMPFNPRQYAPRWWLAKDIGLPFDKRSKIEVLIDEKLAGHTVLPSPIPNAWLFGDGFTSRGRTLLPLGGVSHQRVLVCNETGHWVYTQTDEHGFNNTEGSFSSVPIDALLIGDSYAFGECVEQTNTIAGYLRGKKVKTVSLGYGGVGPLYELAVLSEYGPHLKPQVVFWMYFDFNDPMDLEDETQESARLLKRYYQDGHTQNLIGRQDEVDDVLRRYLNDMVQKKSAKLKEVVASREELEIWWINHWRWLNRYENSSIGRFLKLWRLQSIVLGRDLIRTPVLEQQPEIGEKLKTILLAAKRRVDGWGGQLVFVYLSDRTRYSKARSDSWRQRDMVLSVVDDLTLPIIDIGGMWAQHHDPISFFPFRQDSHYNTEGYSFIANQLLTVMNKFRN